MVKENFRKRRGYEGFFKQKSAENRISSWKLSIMNRQNEGYLQKNYSQRQNLLTLNPNFLVDRNF